MKKIITIALCIFSLTVFASIEYEGESSTISKEEMAKNRSCFQELTVQGCGDPGEDHKQFRSCMSHVYPKLSKDCKALMTKLYTRK